MPNFRLRRPGVTLPLRTASTGRSPARRMARRAQSTLREGWYLMTKMAPSTPSMARNTPVCSFRSWGRATFCLRMKYALPMATVSPRIMPVTPPSSQKRRSSTRAEKPPSAASCWRNRGES